ncbi:cell division protein ZapE [Halorhodospira halophila]|uniref:Cell division protein ZapE n=1 Tax=Halorhodospira halophila (strain DSM 244 / SL1) TaxID=349124 RepID=A1WVL8_HALHL|nr:cell division protein ZapE [Halorhodospira halophila]ABM61730.1 AFG1-family ATPase [Halorhodospira halophila SL1]MBK1728940.1 cell division protein ZapE [Halorhodospira halophila]
MPVQTRYQDDLARGVIHPDPAQQRAVQALQSLHDELSRQPTGDRWLGWLRRRPNTAAPGLYLHGPVGRGKTYLVDAFFDALPFADKERLHFHHFMRRTHDALHQLRDHRDPLGRLARDFAAEHRVLCFDEFHVSDIADAMILGRLLEQLIGVGVTLVATSNVPPDDLYRDGLQRARFLPAIDALKRHCRVVGLDGGRDYRLERLEQAPVYWIGPAGDHDDSLEERFVQLAPEPGRANLTLDIEGRPVPARRCADGIAWFDFAALCSGPRGASDYIELARLFHTVLVSDVPRFDASCEDEARRWIALIDELYERRVNLICSAAVTPEALYAGRRLGFEFQRTASRLHEMQSHDYLAEPHRP